MLCLNEELGRHRNSSRTCDLCTCECKSVEHVLWECSEYIHVAFIRNLINYFCVTTISIGINWPVETVGTRAPNILYTVRRIYIYIACTFGMHNKLSQLILYLE